MNDLVVVALIQGGVAVLLLILGARLNGKVKRVQEDAAATRVQVENNHPTNLREEADERHGENSGKLDTLLEDVGVIRRSLRRLWERSDKHNDAIHELEMTQPPSRARGS